MSSLNVGARIIRRLTKRLSMALFVAGDRLGFHVLPKHYYTSVHDVQWLRRNRDAWMPPAEMHDVVWDIEEQLSWVRQVCDPYYHEVKGLSFYREAAAMAAGPGYGPIESQVLHCFLRTVRPARVIEIGSGISTFCMLNAGALNAADGCSPSEITCIEPFPRPALQREPQVRLISRPAQVADASTFEDLRKGDLLFIDSTHVVKAGSDLLRIYLDILPGLIPGVFVHIHDITLPYLYNRDILRSYFDWQESTLLLALLTGNPNLQVLGSLSALHYACGDRLKDVLPDYRPQKNNRGLAPVAAPGHFPSSLYLLTGPPPEARRTPTDR